MTVRPGWVVRVEQNVAEVILSVTILFNGRVCLEQHSADGYTQAQLMEAANSVADILGELDDD